MRIFRYLTNRARVPHSSKPGRRMNNGVWQIIVSVGRIEDKENICSLSYIGGEERGESMRCEMAHRTPGDFPMTVQIVY